MKVNKSQLLIAALFLAVFSIVGIFYNSTVAITTPTGNPTYTPAGTSPLDNLQPGEWYAAPNSNMRTVVPPYGAPTSPQGTPTAIMDAWSSGAYDTTRNRLIVWGGGHMDYAGNEIYVFDINTFTWQRLTNPSPYIYPNTSSTNPDGTPVSRHTYDGLQYLPNVDKFWANGGSIWTSGFADNPNATWTFDFNALKWQRKQDNPAYPDLAYVTAYDPATGRVFHYGPSSGSQFYEYDPVADIWANHGAGSAGTNGGQKASIDSKRRKFVAVGGGMIFSIDLNPATGVYTRQDLVTTGDQTIVNGYYPGFEYDPVDDVFVGWTGGASVYTLNMDTLVWTKRPPATTNTVIPTATSYNGVFGRFRYIPSKNVFVAVNSIDENVYFYRLSTSSVNPTSTGQIDLPPKQWVALPLPDPLFAQAVKHLSGALNPDNGRLYFTGGDHSGGPFTDPDPYQASYRQETYSLSLAERFADKANGLAGWRLEYPYCGPTGQVQPNVPDFVGWVWDATRHLFWMVPGTMVGVADNTGTVICPNGSQDLANAGFRHIMAFDPAAKRWTSFGAAPHESNENWGAAYDPQTDTLLRVKAVNIELYDIKSGTWTLVPIQLPGLPPGVGVNGKTIHIEGGLLANNLAARVVYDLDPINERLYAYHWDGKTLEDLGPVPGPVARYDLTFYQPQIVWDSINGVLLWQRYHDGFFAYHPDTKTWETLSTDSNLSGIMATGRIMTFDAQQNAVVLFGIGDVGYTTPPNITAQLLASAPYMFLYRYGNGSTTSQLPTISLSLSPLAITSGQSSTLTWSSTNATSCTASGGWSGNEPLAGSQLVAPTTNTTYTLTCTGAGGSLTRSATLNVTSPTPSSTLSNLTFIPNVEGQQSLASDVFTISIYSPSQTTPLYTSTTTGGTIVLTQSTLPPGSYDLSLLTPYHLKRKLTNLNLSSNQTITMPLLYAGDLTNHNTVNSLDWSIMSAKWFTADPIADINQDGIVNSIDFSYLNKNWGKVGD